MEWLEISVQADGEAAEAVSELFNRVNSRPDGPGAAVIEIGGFDPVGENHHLSVVVKTYLPVTGADTQERRQEIERGLWFLRNLYPLGEPQARYLAEEEWAEAWRAGYRPFRVGRRFLIIPAWLRGQVRLEPSDLPIVLDPGMAFGTGLHPSTRLCLMAMEEIVRSGQRVLDVGCGSGILSIAAARLGAAAVTALDIDPMAVQATVANVALNELPISVQAFVSAGPDGSSFWHPAAGPRPTWDVIVVNILPHTISELLAAGLHTYLAPAGHLILAGLIAEREAEMLATLARHGLDVVGRMAEGDWVGLVCTISVSSVCHHV